MISNENSLDAIEIDGILKSFWMSKECGKLEIF